MLEEPLQEVAVRVLRAFATGLENITFTSDVGGYVAFREHPERNRFSPAASAP